MSSSGRPTVAPLIVGAYAALPADAEGQEAFYSGLATRGLATGLEIPFRDGLGVAPDWFAAQVRGRYTDSALTLIPGTMVRVGRDGSFGLASPDADGRRAALAYVRQAREAAEDLNQRTGEPTVTVLHIHSAPSVTAVPDALGRSLAELAGDGTWSTRLALEHCDAHSPDVPGEKRFLALEAEIPVAREAGIPITINWGRSAVEAQDARRPGEHVAMLAQAGLLGGLMFSGAGGGESRYGTPWADAHLPLTEDEPTSLLDRAEVARCLRLAAGRFSYLGAKIQVPSATPVEQRLDMIGHVTRLLRENPTGAT